MLVTAEVVRNNQISTLILELSYTILRLLYKILKCNWSVPFT